MAEYKTLGGLDLDIGAFTDSVTRSKQTLEDVARKSRGIGTKPETEEIELDSNFLKGIAQLFKDNGYEPEQPSENNTATIKDKVLDEYVELIKSDSIQDAMKKVSTLGDSPNKVEDIYTAMDTDFITLENQPSVDSEGDTLEIEQTEPLGLMSKVVPVVTKDKPIMAETPSQPDSEASVDSDIISATFLNAIGITGKKKKKGVQSEVKKVLKEQGMSDEEITSLVDKSINSIPDADEVQLTGGKDSIEQGLMTKPKARPIDITEEDVQEIIGANVDGDFGPTSKAKLKAWQYVHNLPITGELDTKTLYALTDADKYNPETIARDNFVQSKTFDLLKGVEGFKENAYIGAIGPTYKSGLTVGAGIDFGQHTKQSLLDMGLEKDFVEKAEKAGWVGLNPDTIIDPDTGRTPAADVPKNKRFIKDSEGNDVATEEWKAARARGEELLKAKKEKQEAEGTFPKFTTEELYTSAPIVYKTYEDAARDQYNKAVNASPIGGESFKYKSFDELSKATKAVLTLEKYHRGEDYDISSMIVGARKDDAKKAADEIKYKSRRKNMKDWLKKVGF